jgi:hypothetical protein
MSSSSIALNNSQNIGQLANTINNSFQLKDLFKLGWSWVSGLKDTAVNTVKEASPVLSRAKNDEFIGLGQKGIGIVAAAYSSLSALINFSDAVRMYAGSPGDQAGSACLLKAGIDVGAAAGSLACAFGKVNALVPLGIYALSGAFKFYESLALNKAGIMNVPIVNLVTRHQERGPSGQIGESKFRKGYSDIFTDGMDDWIRANILKQPGLYFVNTRGDNEREFDSLAKEINTRYQKVDTQG